MGLRFILVIICLSLVLVLISSVLSIDIDWKSPQVQQGAIAALVVISGWLVTAVFREGTVLLDRIETARDVLSALRAEIADFDEALSVSQDDAQAMTADLEIRVLSATGRRPYFPFFPKVPSAIVANRLEEELRVMPHRVVGPVVQFYATLADINVMINDMRDSEFRAMSADRRLAMYKDYLEVRFRLGEVAEAALADIDHEFQSGFISLSEKLSALSLGRLLGTHPHGRG
jgi:hypothetical protein